MNGKHYLGKAVTSFEEYNDVGPITGVSVLVDDGTEYRSGGSSGYLLTVKCTYGSQELANNILLDVYQKTYKGYRAAGAQLPLDAELGDAVTINGLYSFLAYQSVTFGPGHMSEIAAPGDNEVTHEYQYTATSKKNISGDVTALRNVVQQMLGAMQIELNSIKTALDTLTLKVNDISLAVTNLDSRVSALEGKVNAG